MKKILVCISLLVLMLALPAAAVTEIRGGFSSFNTKNKLVQGNCYFDALQGNVCPGLELKRNFEYRAFPKRTRARRFEGVPTQYRGDKIPHQDATTNFLMTVDGPSSFIMKGSPQTQFPKRVRRAQIRTLTPSS